MKASWSALVGSSGSRGVPGVPAVVRRVFGTTGGNPATTDTGKKEVWTTSTLPPRIGLYGRRIAPDSAGFRRLPAIARPGNPFESHLGHGKPPGQRGFLLLSVDSC